MSPHPSPPVFSQYIGKKSKCACDAVCENFDRSDTDGQSWQVEWTECAEMVRRQFGDAVEIYCKKYQLLNIIYWYIENGIMGECKLIITIVQTKSDLT